MIKLRKILKEIEEINAENERLAKLYDGHFSFVKTFQEFANTYSNLNHSDIEKAFSIIFDNIESIVDNKDNLLVQGREGFINDVKKKTSRKMMEKSSTGNSLYKELQFKNNYEYLLSQLYTNLLLY